MKPNGKIELSSSAQMTRWYCAPVNPEAEEYRRFSTRKDFEFWFRSCDAYARPGQPILDLCCGMGMMTMAIADRGYNVVGIDVNGSFVEWARESDRTVRQPALPQNAGTVEFIAQDIVTFELNRKFPLVIMTYGFTYLLTTKDITSCLAQVYKHLGERGKFIFDIFEALGKPDGTVGPKDVSDLKIWHKSGDDPHLWRIDSDKPFYRFSTFDELQNLLNAAHFKIIGRENTYHKGGNTAFAIIAEKL